MRLLPDEDARLISVADAAVRTNIYGIKRADGTYAYGVEEALQQIESRSAPILHNLEECWPLSNSDKAKVAQFLGLQAVRGPHWRAFYRSHVEDWVEEVSAEEPERLGSRPKEMSEAEFKEAAREWLQSDRQRLEQMLSVINKAASVIGSMHWTLLGSRPGAFITSDHPLVKWPLSRVSSSPCANREADGFLPTLEVRFPLRPNLCLLMTWVDAADPTKASRASNHIVKNINGWTRANAERQWFHRPGARPRIGNGDLLPISPEIIPGYNASVARFSERRRQAKDNVQPLLGKKVDEVTIAVVSANAA